MRKVTLKIPAKINLTLDVLGENQGFHNLNSFVASVNIYDTITVKKRKDGAIKLKTKGLPVQCGVAENNAFKAGKLFVKKFGTKGANITVRKAIPVGGGLGGSSADIAGVLKGMEALYSTGGQLSPLANVLGSDCAYMLQGGYAVLTGRGEKVDNKQINNVLYLVIVHENISLRAGEVYAVFDELNVTSSSCTDMAVKALTAGDLKDFCSIIKNDLTQSAQTKANQIQNNINALKQAGALTALMTGSGACCYGVFENKKARNKAFKKLKNIYGKNVIKAQTIV